MMQEEHSQPSRAPMREFSAGSLLLLLSLGVYVFFGRTGDTGPAVLAALVLELLYLLAGTALLGLGRHTRMSLLVATQARDYEADLLAVFRHLMTALAVLALAFSLAGTALRLLPEAEPEQPLPVFMEDQAPGDRLSGPEILASTRVIAHAMGAVDGNSYLNCLEGFQAMYSRGVRVFEADFCLAADGTVVLRHDWSYSIQNGISPTAVPTREKFLSVPILDRYTPLSFHDLLLLMEEYPDICIVTDSKYTTPEVALTEFASMLRDAQELGLTHVFDRIVIQIYSREMLEALEQAYSFRHYIFTLYMTDFDGTDEHLRSFAQYCAEHHVEGITMWAYLWKPSFLALSREYGIPIYIHTLNDPEQAKDFLAQGVSAVYTDSLADRDLLPAVGPQG